MRMLLLADMHIGAVKDTSYYYNSMTNIIDKEVTFSHCDAVIILGDYFDRLFKVNEEYVALAINVMSYLVRTCLKSNTKIRLIYGTESHEMNQYKLFNHFLSSSTIDIKLITTCTEEELFPGVNVLYVPEEYIGSKLEFYKDTIYSGKVYDYIFGHGTITEGMPEGVRIARESDNINTENKVPHFNAGELSKAAKLVAFGHEHKPWDLENVHYIGSLFRWCFGEEDPKRYAIVEDGKIKFIENKFAYTYKDYTFNEDDPVYESSDNLIRAINNIKRENMKLFKDEMMGKIRLIFHLPQNINPTFKEDLKALLFHDKVLSSLIKENITDTVMEDEEVVDEEIQFVIDTSLKIDDKIYNYILKTHQDTTMSMKELVKYIHEPLQL